ncbi:monovalent cation:proton antiporter-2 (CPA2) family protein [Enterococcus sp. ALS3]|uniref:Monovalent cation:proton antiporter-2 (CPA2) family protein n=1 Tax=Enterococcus alishanensis TaxID=1303817 RepID=A0ABS6TCD5_9ENTE|nr:monovalent cation:proton antiporter-2 (CPA2) family protein [Enterococcus alishanensis]MBV7390578.1 monovalent cation:proton antiporter-2 (CPA2) family protein [Enterococcus alishanensis]
MAFIGILVIILITTTLAAHFSKRIGLPAVIGQLIVGVLLGQGGLNWVHPNLLVTEFSEIGVILLMFIAGLESDLSLLRKYFRPAILVASFGIVLPLILAFAGGKLLQIASNQALFFGIILAATSVSISVEVLKELRALDSKEGATILGAAVLDDILTVLLVSLSVAFIAEKNQASLSENFFVLAKEIGFFVFIFFLVKWIAPFLMKLAQRLFTTSAVIIVSLIICLGMAYFADFVGLSSVVGAFFAGIAVGQTEVKELVNQNMEALGYSIFIPVFFVSIGLEVNFQSMATQLGFILLMVVVAVASKLLGGFFGAKISGFENNSAWMIGSGMVSRGEMALIILQLGSANLLVADKYYSSLVMIILFSTLLSPLILKYFTQKVYPKI